MRHTLSRSSYSGVPEPVGSRGGGGPPRFSPSRCRGVVTEPVGGGRTGDGVGGELHRSSAAPAAVPRARFPRQPTPRPARRTKVSACRRRPTGRYRPPRSMGVTRARPRRGGGRASYGDDHVWGPRNHARRPRSTGRSPCSCAIETGPSPLSMHRLPSVSSHTRHCSVRWTLLMSFRLWKHMKQVRAPTESSLAEKTRTEPSIIKRAQWPELEKVDSYRQGLARQRCLYRKEKPAQKVPNRET